MPVSPIRSVSLLSPCSAALSDATGSPVFQTSRCARDHLSGKPPWPAPVLIVQVCLQRKLRLAEVGSCLFLLVLSQPSQCLATKFLIRDVHADIHKARVPVAGSCPGSPGVTRLCLRPLVRRGPENH